MTKEKKDEGTSEKTSTPKVKPAAIPKPSEIKQVKAIRATLVDIPVVLACGIVHDGVVYRDVTALSAVVGDRKAFGTAQNRKNGSKMITRFLAAKVRGFGEAPFRVQDRIFLDMLAPDREQIVMEIRQATHPERNFEETFLCPECEERNSVTITYEEIVETFKPMPDDVRLNIENGRCVFDIEMEEYGFKGTFSHSYGKLQERMSGKIDRSANPFEVEVELLAELCVDWMGEGKIDVDYLNELDTEFLEELQDEIALKAYGYDLAPFCKCYNCDTETKVGVNPLDFLLGGARRTMTRRKRRK